MSLDINKVSIKTSLNSCFGNNLNEIESSTDFFNELAAKAEEIIVGKNNYLFHENEPSDFVYVPVSGSVMLERSTSTGSRQVFSFLFTGNILGISEHSVYRFSAKTLTESTVIKINQKLIKSIFDKYPVIAQRYHAMTHHILTLILDQLFIMGQKKTSQRIANFLIDMEHRIGHGSNRFHLPMSRQDIADYLGMSLETGSRGFSKLKNEGFIQIDNNYQITILEHDKLVSYADN